MDERSSSVTQVATAQQATLRVTPDQDLSLSELAGNPVILAFYPADWSPVCGDLYNEVLPEFQKQGAELVGISVDGAWCHQAFARDRRLHFPLVADFEPSKVRADFLGGGGVNGTPSFFINDRRHNGSGGESRWN